MTSLDHLLVFVLVVLVPLQGWSEIRSLIAALRRGDAWARSQALLGTIALQWTLALALLAGWQTGRRDWAALGLTLPGGWRAAIGVAAVAATAWLVWKQERSVARLDPERRRRLRERSGDGLLLLPTTRTEQRIFAATAVTAGVCEELLCRGFLFWYLSRWLGPWVVVIAASVPFGLAHIYQGTKGAVKTGVVALFLGALYVGSGSLIWPMIVHAMIDLGAGRLGPLLAAPSTRPEDSCTGEAASPLTGCTDAR